MIFFIFRKSMSNEIICSVHEILCRAHDIIFSEKRIGLFLIYNARKKFKHKNLQQKNRKQEKKLTTKPFHDI